MKPSGKELIQVGIFTAIYVVIYMIFNAAGAFSPVLQVFTGPIATVVNGITFMLFLARIHHAVCIEIMALILSVLMVVMGHHPITLLTALIAGGIAWWLASDRSAVTGWRSIFSYAFFSLWPIGAYLPLLFMRDAVLAETASQMGAEWTRVYASLMSGPMLAVLTVLCFVAGLLGGLLGRSVLQKSFVKAGLA
ncbi:energy-coupling factor transport system substrate-specific component [Propionibacterium cyclohexanicum]|uniref:Energy-coupling factor transport system substrate-specific component n=1 Tax=Propionibacterium cyclohexanicum TaxID=64702 RepID=A0A1H9RRY6_9ACTN|nr:MptD family putative ECF transporter S component [Propionibacterium cyclohexanicum]SER75711.1 energy-coupling factor transport system substrate-specific component [Propionibacterium cyclohexanicum]